MDNHAINIRRMLAEKDAPVKIEMTDGRFVSEEEREGIEVMENVMEIQNRINKPRRPLYFVTPIERDEVKKNEQEE